jgi:hypothetical protein
LNKERRRLIGNRLAIETHGDTAASELVESPAM